MQDSELLWSLGLWEYGCAIGSAGGWLICGTRRFGETSIRNQPSAIVCLDHSTSDVFRASVDCHLNVQFLVDCNGLDIREAG